MSRIAEIRGEKLIGETVIVPPTNSCRRQTSGATSVHGGEVKYLAL
jgi:hypothetical protein